MIEKLIFYHSQFSLVPFASHSPDSINSLFPLSSSNFLFYFLFYHQFSPCPTDFMLTFLLFLVIPSRIFYLLSLSFPFPIYSPDFYHTQLYLTSLFTFLFTSLCLVAGNETGITTFQLDIKSEGLTLETLERALLQVRSDI